MPGAREGLFSLWKEWCFLNVGMKADAQCLPVVMALFAGEPLTFSL